MGDHLERGMAGRFSLLMVECITFGLVGKGTGFLMEGFDGEKGRGRERSERVGVR